MGDKITLDKMSKKPLHLEKKQPTPSVDSQWEIWEWENSEDREALIQDAHGDSCTWEEIPNMVAKEIRRLHDQIGEETGPFEAFVKQPQNSTSTALHILYELPATEAEAPDHFRLMKSCNGHILYGLSAWRKGTNPEYHDHDS